MLRVEVADDGRGVEEGGLRQVIVRRGLADEAMVARLSSEEVLAFLFLPGFTTAASVSDVSGRGVGLDVAMEAVKQVGGKVHVTNRPGAGLTLRFDVPVTLSVMAALIAEVAGEPYALPMNRIERVERVARDVVRTLEGRAYVPMTLAGEQAAAAAAPPSGPGPREEQLVGLVTARQVLGVPGDPPPGDTVSVVVIRDGRDLYGLVVDRIVGEQSIAVRPLDARLGKVPNIGAAGLMVDAEPLLVVDVDDLVRRIDQILTGGRLAPIVPGDVAGPSTGKRVLVVDDSITVREVERQLLESQGYHVEVAVDGIDGWNAVRTGRYDLVVTDVDMPRMDGFELVRRIRADRRSAALPVMVVSYKDRDEDRLRGLDAGASYYLPKASFQDESFLAAVVDLIGHPTES
jgi:two-component system sensor histidine kinase and response regulator WspE